MAEYARREGFDADWRSAAGGSCGAGGSGSKQSQNGGISARRSPKPKPLVRFACLIMSATPGRNASMSLRLVLGNG